MHESLNCFTMLEIFSQRCGSACSFRVHDEMTRNVARSASAPGKELASTSRGHDSDHADAALTKEHDLVSLADLGKLGELALQHLHARDERVDDSRPSAIQRLVPD